MNLVKKVLDKLNGLHYRQEYLCFAKESFSQPPRAYLVNNNRIIKDITDHHSFNGYCPVIFTLYSLEEIAAELRPSITIVFSHKTLQPNDIFNDKDAIAMLILKKIKEQAAGSDILHYYEATHGNHKLIPEINQFVIELSNRFFNKKPGNVFLAGNLYKQVQIAYSIPRIISLITVGKDNLFNLFPTDLHGPVGRDHYLISLRHEGKACRQVMENERILISQVRSDAFKTVYGLGKNHMQEFKTAAQFPFSDSRSFLFQLPLPATALLYRELELKDSYIDGIHKLMLFKIVSSQPVVADPLQASGTLAHIHNAYATWRYNNQLEGNYLFR